MTANLAGWNRPQPLSFSASQVDAFRGKIQVRPRRWPSGRLIALSQPETLHLSAKCHADDVPCFLERQLILQGTANICSQHDIPWD